MIIKFFKIGLQQNIILENFLINCLYWSVLKFTETVIK